MACCGEAPVLPVACVAAIRFTRADLIRSPEES